jgi:hypothetical protein
MLSRVGQFPSSRRFARNEPGAKGSSGQTIESVCTLDCDGIVGGMVAAAVLSLFMPEKRCSATRSRETILKIDLCSDQIHLLTN